MRNVSAGGDQPRLPPELERDHHEFVSRIREWLESCERGLSSLELFTLFGLKVYEHARRTSLIARGDRAHLYTRHVLDSLNPVNLYESPPPRVLDIGSGGGFPGIPLAIAWPRTTVTLLESRDKKAGFLELVARDLGLTNVKVVCDRLERFEPRSADQRPMASFIRAVGGLGQLVPTLARISEDGGRWIYYLGGETSVEQLKQELGPWGESVMESEGRFGGRLLWGELPRA
jgi:16S rRNA (guanine(527)-N(7))-methyltransferase RsmG